MNIFNSDFLLDWETNFTAHELKLCKSKMKQCFSFKIMTILTFILKSHLRDRLKQGQNEETWIHIN